MKTPSIPSKLPRVGTTIFSVMSALAQEHGATFWTQDIDYQGLPGVHCFAKS